MSDAKAEARQRAIDHIARLLILNPMLEGPEIIRVRSEALGLAKKVDSSCPAVPGVERADRRKLLESLEAVRAQFWTLPLDALNGRLDALAGQGYVDIEAAVARLRVVAAHRARFPVVAQQPGFDGDFFSTLKEILIRSPRDTAVLREQVLSTFRNRASRKRGRRMLKLINGQLPAIYDLEADWFNTLSRQKQQTVFRLKSHIDRSQNALNVNEGSRAWVFVALMVGMAIARGCSSSHRDRDRYSAPSRLPSDYQYQLPPQFKPGEVTLGDGKIKASNGGLFFRSEPGETSPNPQPDRSPPVNPERLEFESRGGSPGGFPRPLIFDPEAPWNRPDVRPTR